MSSRRVLGCQNLGLDTCHFCNSCSKMRCKACDFSVFTLCVHTSSLRLDTRRRGAFPRSPRPGSEVRIAVMRMKGWVVSRGLIGDLPGCFGI